MSAHRLPSLPACVASSSNRLQGGQEGGEMDFTFKDAKNLWSLVRRQDALVDKKRRWLESMIPGPDGRTRRVKRPKFLNDVYLAESDIRSEEVFCEKVRASVERCCCPHCCGYNYHLVQDALLLFNLQKGDNGSLSTESLQTMHCTINKLTNEALQSVASIVTYSKCNFERTRPIMKNIIKEHLPNYFTKLDGEDSMSQLAKILRNPHSYKSDSVSLVTPVSPLLLSCINQALDVLDGMPMQLLLQ